ncbi:hypothetical protein DACRYDRAFT_52977 [Dacryopinax primogenitus]|uniref:Uncharacterized protein n=1 Tax=Dacryopinax primogenitus (strain DJM 731) TaxID=1858805 RepID=M5GC07_DACPD|nr:uncharacterized protein DACRYDRAFT_52977 [Dacryopinax primogenitus]EJU01563.1 hypothetical protein DACRYDRAFT_52977 [Dacryopinax primogenitus]
MPDILYFDNNCNLCCHLANRSTDVHEHFKHTMLVVDTFHWRTKHQLSNNPYCNMHCNPANYQELYMASSPNKWCFNSSVCEQMNSWVHPFAGLICEMTAVC